MKNERRQLAVLNCLESSSVPLSVPDLIKKLGSDYPERTVRRWLAHFVSQGLVEKKGQKRSTLYWRSSEEATSSINEQQHQLQTLHSAFFSIEAINAIDRIRQPIFERTPSSYDFNWFDAYTPNVTYYLTQSERSQLEQAGKRNLAQEPAGTYARKISNRLLIDLSYNSSRLEGNTYSLIETEQLLSDGLGVEGKLDVERVMILNHKEAIRYLIDNVHKLKPDLNEVCTLHYLLSDALVLNSDSGKVRNQAVKIGGSTYIPSAERSALQEQLEQICEKADRIINPYEKSLFLLVHIAYLQAFIDVNKRTSRLSANIPLMSNNLVPLSFNDVDKEDYSSSMISVYELKTARPIAELFCFSYLRTCLQYDATVESMEFDEIRVRYRQQRRDLVRHIISTKVAGDKLTTYIANYSERNIPANDVDAFHKSVADELKEIGPHRIAGMGITVTELSEWLILQGDLFFK